MKKYTLENKPSFTNWQLVKIDMTCISSNFNAIKQGKVVGKSLNGIIDMWLIEFNEIISEEYQYSTAAIPHTFIIEEIN